MSGFDALVATLEQPAPVYLLVGGEDWLVRQALERIRAAVVAGPVAAFNDATFVAAEDREGSFVHTARTVPMMAARRLVVLKQVEEASVALLDALLAYAAAPVPSAVLVVTGEKFPGAVGGVDRGLRIVNAVKKTGFVAKLDRQEVDPVRFATEAAAGLGARLAPAGARLLVDFSGGELALVHAGVEKCATYVGEGGLITEEVVEAVCVSTAEAEVWALTDAIVGRDRARALAALHHLLEDGEAPHKLLANVAWQLRQVLVLQDATRRGIAEREAGVRMPPQKARAIREMLTRRPLSPRQLLEELAEVNTGMNSSRAGERRVFEAWILRLVDRLAEPTSSAR